jgi:hypothetical protein
MKQFSVLPEKPDFVSSEQIPEVVNGKDTSDT